MGADLSPIGCFANLTKVHWDNSSFIQYLQRVVKVQRRPLTTKFVAACRSGGAQGRQRGGSTGPGGGRTRVGVGTGGGGASAAAGAASNAQGAAEVRREDGSVQCTFSSNGDDFVHQHW